MHQSLTKKLLYCCRFLSKNSSWMIWIIYKTSCLLRGARKGSPQLQWIWRLQKNKNCMNDTHHIFSVINDAWSKNQQYHPISSRLHLPQKKKIWMILITIKYCACHTKAMSGFILFRYEKSFLFRKATDITLQPHQILGLPCKITTAHLTQNLPRTDKASFPTPTNRHDSRCFQPRKATCNPPRLKAYFSHRYFSHGQPDHYIIYLSLKKKYYIFFISHKKYQINITNSYIYQKQ